MNQPLGKAVGNWLEVKESIDCLKGSGPADVNALSHLLAGAMIFLGGKAQSIQQGMDISVAQVDNGQAFQKWVDIVQEQGGDVELIHHPEKYPKAGFEFELKSNEDGYISSLNSYEIGMASLELGAGRRAITEQIDPTAGILFEKKVGDKIMKGETILKAFTNKPAMIETVTEQLYGAVEINTEQPVVQQLVSHICDSQGTRAFEL
jgi:pyrimidine-nucleoside phosphorylase